MKPNKRIAFLFPGQGAQYPGMGKDFVHNFPTARLTLEEADDLLGRKLSSIILEGPEDQLTKTQNSQTGIYVISIAILRTLQEVFPALKPSFCAGLSLGEYTAIHASKRMAFSDCLQLIQHRGQFMNDACEETRGSMAVIIGLDADTVEKLVKDVGMPNDLWAANYNCPGQIVISGTLRGIEAGTEAAKAKGSKRVLPLQVHGAFHSGLMATAERRLAPYIEHAPMCKSDIELVMNVVGKPVNELGEIRKNLIQQVTQSVRWEQGIRYLDSANADLFIEIGCGKSLSGFNKRIGVKAPTLNVENIIDLSALEKALQNEVVSEQ